MNILSLQVKSKVCNQIILSMRNMLLSKKLGHKLIWCEVYSMACFTGSQVGVKFCNSPTSLFCNEILYTNLIHNFVFVFLFLLLYKLYFLFDVHCEFKSTPLISNTYFFFYILSIYFKFVLLLKPYGQNLLSRNSYQNKIFCHISSYQKTVYIEYSVSICCFSKYTSTNLLIQMFFYRNGQIKVVF